MNLVVFDCIINNILYYSIIIKQIFVTHNIQEVIILSSRIIILGTGGEILFDKHNELKKPVSPASAGYGELWEKIRNIMYK